MGCKLLDVTYIMEVGPGHELPTWMCFLFKQLLDIFFSLCGSWRLECGGYFFYCWAMVKLNMDSPRSEKKYHAMCVCRLHTSSCCHGL